MPKFLVSEVHGLTVGLVKAPSAFLSEPGEKVLASQVEPAFLELVETTDDYKGILHVEESDDGPSADDTKRQRGDTQGSGNVGALGKNESGTEGATAKRSAK